MRKKEIFTGSVVGVLVIGLLIFLNVSSGDDPVSTVNTTTQTQQRTPAAASSNSSETTQQSTTTTADSNYVAYTGDNLSSEDQQTILFFHAPWCIQCRDFEQDILANLDLIPDDVRILKVDYDSNQALRQQFDVTLQTTFVDVDSKQKWVGYYEERTLATMLTQFR